MLQERDHCIDSGSWEEIQSLLNHGLWRMNIPDTFSSNLWSLWFPIIVSSWSKITRPWRTIGHGWIWRLTFKGTEKLSEGEPRADPQGNLKNIPQRGHLGLQAVGSDLSWAQIKTQAYLGVIYSWGKTKETDWEPEGEEVGWGSLGREPDVKAGDQPEWRKDKGSEENMTWGQGPLCQDGSQHYHTSISWSF